MPERPQLQRRLSRSPAFAISNPELLGPWFVGESWNTWRAILKAAWAEPLTDSELATFKTVAGNRNPPRHRVKELWVIAGRRSGKDSVASAIATVSALTDYKQYLRPGERASVLCLAVDRAQAQIVHRYISHYFKEVPDFQQLVVRESSDGLELKNGAEVVVATNSFRSVRGRTIAAVVLDECAFWRDETSSTPDVETYNALVPGLITLPGSLLIGITTAYRKSGLAYQQYHDHFGTDNDDVLVVYGPSTLFNPTLPQAVIDKAIKRDPEAARAEWLSEWRSDLSDFISRELVDAAVDTGIIVRKRESGIRYAAFCDPSGGRGDAFTAAIAHAEGNNIILDLMFEKRPPFDPDPVVNEITNLIRSYGLTEVTGDRYAAEWVVSAFRRNGITYNQSERDRSRIYLDALPLFTAGRVRLLDNERLIHQFSNLERRASRMGKESVDHGPNGHDDLANSAAGALVLASIKPAPLILPQSIRARIQTHGQLRDRFARINRRMGVG